MIEPILAKKGRNIAYQRESTEEKIAELWDFHLSLKNTYQTETESDEAKNDEVSAGSSMYSFS